MKSFRGLEDGCTRLSRSRLLAMSGMEPLTAVAVSTANYTTADF